MKVEVLDKGDNSVTVKFIGQSPMDATLLALVSMGPTKDTATLSTTSYTGTTKVTFGSVNFDAVEIMQAVGEKT